MLRAADPLRQRHKKGGEAREVIDRNHRYLEPTTLSAPESDGGVGTQITFTRIIVHADGHKEIEGVTPKALPAPKPVDETLMQPGDESNN